jgi:general secretion pathway protein A
MYREFFGLKEKPFNILPDPEYFYLSQWHQQAITHIDYGLMNGDSLILLTGDAGTGKTSIIYKLVMDHKDDTIIGVIFNSAVGGDHIVEMILTELEAEMPEKITPASCLDALQQHLLKIYTQREKRVLLIMDEAQNLSDEALEQVRMISNLQAGKDNLISILMVGQSGFRDRLRKARYSQIVQRIVVSAHLSRLRETEVKEYIYYRLRQGEGTIKKRRRWYGKGQHQKRKKESLHGTPAVDKKHHSQHAEPHGDKNQRIYSSSLAQKKQAPGQQQGSISRTT